jgi:ketosteroid isomerase-like protein
MSDHGDLIRRYWDAADRRDWEAFAATLAADVVYEVPQTRERVRGRDAYLRFNRDYPGDWRVTIRRVVADRAGGVAWTDFTIGDETQTGIHFFTVGDDGLITRVDDFWPEPYDPPPGRDHLVERF